MGNDSLKWDRVGEEELFGDVVESENVHQGERWCLCPGAVLEEGGGVSRRRIRSLQKTEKGKSKAWKGRRVRRILEDCECIVENGEVVVGVVVTSVGRKGMEVEQMVNEKFVLGCQIREGVGLF